MDSEHRHELMESDLVVAWEKFKTWWTKHSTKVLGVAVLAAALILGIRYFRAKAAAAREQEQWLLATETGPDSFRQLAKEADSATVEALANLRGADLLLAEVARPGGPGQPAISPEKRKASLDLADAMCKDVLSANKHPVLAFNARLRLASIAESRGLWDQAREQYQAVQKDAGKGYEYFSKLAAVYEKILPRIATPPVFAKEEEKPPALPLPPLPPLLPDPVKPDPSKPDPVKPDPAKPDPAKPDPSKLDPSKPEPAKPDPSKPAPIKPEPAKPEPSKPEPAKPDASKPEPAKPDPAKPDPAKPAPTKDSK